MPLPRRYVPLCAVMRRYAPTRLDRLQVSLINQLVMCERRQIDI